MGPYLQMSLEVTTKGCCRELRMTFNIPGVQDTQCPWWQVEMLL
jgi:hypothetical protein